mmetsp:Transcript_79700/g.223583  ORF Transcript_79700/g.223583 Transcript_79700/m.223583 type:complete len:99 (-) Transcript_79700:130-426(-)
MQETITSKEKNTMQNTTPMSKALSAVLWVRNNLKSSPQSAQTVNKIPNVTNNLLSTVAAAYRTSLLRQGDFNNNSGVDWEWERSLLLKKDVRIRPARD